MVRSPGFRRQTRELCWDRSTSQRQRQRQTAAFVVSQNRRMNDPSKNQKDFFRIVTISTALGFGTLAAFLYSMKDVTHDAQLVFSAGTVIVFVLAAAAGWAFWRIVRAFAERHK